MNIRRIFGIILFIGGIGMLGTSFYIKTQVLQGQQEITAGQKKVDRAKAPFSIVPGTKPIGNILTGSGQTKIDNGQQQVDEYEALANKLQMGGIILLVAGLGFIVLSISRKK